VDREALLAINGRSRKEQIRLAAELGVDEYPQPAGGCCFLTDHNMAGRFQDLFGSRPTEDIALEDVLLLKLGRHFRLNERVKIIVGRFEAENTFLEGYKNRKWLLIPASTMGPSTLVDGDTIEEADLALAAQVTARYSDADKTEPVTFDVIASGQEWGTLNVKPLDQERIDALRV
jgi:hypothetical protein